MLSTVIFDMDGVLVDSPKYNKIAFQRVMIENGVKIEPAFYDRHLGSSFRDTVADVEKTFDIKLPPLMQLSKRAFSIQLELLKNDLRPSEELNKLLTKLEQNGLKLAVATASMQAAESLLNHLDVRQIFKIRVAGN